MVLRGAKFFLGCMQPLKRSLTMFLFIFLSQTSLVSNTDTTWFRSCGAACSCFITQKCPCVFLFFSFKFPINPKRLLINLYYNVIACPEFNFQFKISMPFCLSHTVPYSCKIYRSRYPCFRLSRITAHDAELRYLR